ncbi:MAG: protein-L-isoaspartate(D-aspartate) O-methyltransferase [Acidobacteriota bacterium]
MDYSLNRRLMVERHLRGRGIRDERVLAAMGSIRREEFIPEERRAEAYLDEPVRIGHGQTISQPYITALMVECLELKGTERVLEVGAGCGYHAAVLAALAASVITVEVIPELAAMARRNLAGVPNVTVVDAGGVLGYPEGAPYDAISVAAAAEEIPAALVDQLADPGRMVIPVGSRSDQELRVVRKKDGKIEWRVAAYCVFVPLVEP